MCVCVLRLFNVSKTSRSQRPKLGIRIFKYAFLGYVLTFNAYMFLDLGNSTLIESHDAKVYVR